MQTRAGLRVASQTREVIRPASFFPHRALGLLSRSLYSQVFTDQTADVEVTNSVTVGSVSDPTPTEQKTRSQYLIFVEVDVTELALLQTVHEVHLLIRQTDISPRHLVLDGTPSNDRQNEC